jgi:hypothetical protein
MRDCFAVFILTHGRPDKVYSYKSLKKSGYTGKVYLLVDNEDSSLPAYKERFGSEVVVFNKKQVAQNVDACDNINRRDSVVYARNYCFELAKKLNISYHLQLDDDYRWFGWTADNHGNYVTANIFTKQIDRIFEATLQFLDDSGAVSVAYAQGGDFIGGSNGKFGTMLKENRFARKAMNSFFFHTDTHVSFRGRVNDDVNLYVERGRMGELFITLPRFRIEQPDTQAESGGCTKVYKDMGTYIKSFYSVMVAPSCVSLAMMGERHRRIHHRVSWKHACPVIVDEKHRKPRPT